MRILITLLMVAIMSTGCVTMETARPVACGGYDCLYRRDPVLPAPETYSPYRVDGVIAPTDSTGKPVEYTQVCDPGCHVVKTPAAIVEYVPPPPPRMYWYQPPPVAVPIVIQWGPMQGTNIDNLPSGPPLHRHR